MTFPQEPLLPLVFLNTFSTASYDTVSGEMPPPRFSTSKFRNAVPHILLREEWYRSSLPSAPATSTSSSLSTFTSEVKTNREWILTLTSSSECSYRPYEPAGEVRTAKVGSGSVGDWDVSRLEGGSLAVGCTDGSVSPLWGVPTPPG